MKELEKRKNQMGALGKIFKFGLMLPLKKIV